MTKTGVAIAMAVMGFGLTGCSGPDVLSASENQIVLRSTDQARAERHCERYGKSAAYVSESPARATYACR